MNNIMLWDITSYPQNDDAPQTHVITGISTCRAMVNEG